MTEIDKEQLYGEYQKGEDARQDQLKKTRAWQDDLHKKLAHKAVDIPEGALDDMDLKVDNRRYGLGFKELVAAAAIGLPLAGLGGAGLISIINSNNAPQTQQGEQQQPTEPIVQPAQPGSVGLRIE